MARLVDVDEAVKFFRGKCVAKYPSTFAFGLAAAADEVAKMETVDSQAYKMLGNGWTVDVIAHIIKACLKEDNGSMEPLSLADI